VAVERRTVTKMVADQLGVQVSHLGRDTDARDELPTQPG
jgi:hypothetical protein